MSIITYRELTPDEVVMFETIDRSEVIDGQYRARGADLQFVPIHIDVQGWYESEIPMHIDNIVEAIAEGGVAFGAWDGDQLVGISALVTKPVGNDPAIMRLEPLHVSAPYRNQGIGTRLTMLVADAARSRGATALYISATPTRNTVDAYIRMGASVLAIPDPELFADEPEDIHLLLQLA